ncbi:protease inhibitor I42 family protein [Streptosporangiaceae bacterium NEAU-GS5]|nr:protease inhibitor I42 family protein [Streptosporangiaceae bacterium NEAU-GS5]
MVYAGRVKRVAALSALALIAGCGVSSASPDVGTPFAGGVGKTVEVRVTSGQRFSLSVPDNDSVGDDWEVATKPDPGVAAFVSEEYAGDPDSKGPGSGGTGYYVYTAKNPGTTSVVLYNCWRCGPAKTPKDDFDRAHSGDATFHIIVT